MRGQRTNNNKAFMVAIRRFPHFELPIRRLFEREETFREICQDLADAEIALAGCASMPAPWREVRQAEWGEVIDRLAGEVDTLIRRDLVEKN